MENSLTICKATQQQLDELSALFNQYRMFYGQASDVTLAKEFLKARMANQQSVVFMSYQQQQAVGFVQLYPTFSSVSAQHAWILNDLFVNPVARRLGAASALMEAAENHARETEAAYIELSTAADNLQAQSLYRKRQYQQDTEFLRFSLRLN